MILKHDLNFRKIKYYYKAGNEKVNPLIFGKKKRT